MCRQRRERGHLVSEEVSRVCLAQQLRGCPLQAQESSANSEDPSSAALDPPSDGDPAAPLSGKQQAQSDATVPSEIQPPLHTPLRKACSQAVLHHKQAGDINNNGQCTHAVVRIMAVVHAGGEGGFVLQMMEDYVTLRILSSTHDSKVELCRQLSTSADVVVHD